MQSWIDRTIRGLDSSYGNKFNRQLGLTGGNKFTHTDDVYEQEVDVGLVKAIETKPNYVILIPRMTKYKMSGGRIGSTIKVNSRNIGKVWDDVIKHHSQHDSFYVEIGVLDEDESHTNPSGNVLSYGKLFRALIKLGYDPLLPLRRKDYVAKCEQRLGSAMERGFEKRRSGGTATTKSFIASVAEDICNEVKNYIAGGTKPKLDGSTIRKRRWYKKNGLAPYNNGVDMALSETGDLEGAIEYRVVSFTSEARKEYYKRKADALKRQIERAKQRKAQRRRETIERKKRKIQELREYRSSQKVKDTEAEKARKYAERKERQRRKDISRLSGIEYKAAWLQHIADTEPSVYEYADQYLLNLESAIRNGEVRRNSVLHLINKYKKIVVYKNDIDKYNEELAGEIVDSKGLADL